MTAGTIVQSIFSLTTIAQTVRLAVPYTCAALGGVWSEKSGVVNIALEGILLVSGLSSVVVHLASGSAFLGLVAAIAAGTAFAGLHALLFVRGKIDAIVSGIALNIVAISGTRFALRAFYRSSSNSPSIEGFRLDAFDGMEGHALLLRTLCDPLTLLTIAMTAATSWILYRTAFGLCVRASGEDPSAASSVGIAVDRVRLAAVALGGGICGVGGAALAYDQHRFQFGMSGGRGFIALAAVIVSGWRPGRALAVCVAFAVLDALQVVLQDQKWLPSDLVTMLQFMATLAVLVAISKKRGGRPQGDAPLGIGKHVEA